MKTVSGFLLGILAAMPLWAAPPAMADSLDDAYLAEILTRLNSQLQYLRSQPNQSSVNFVRTVDGNALAVHDELRPITAPLHLPVADIRLSGSEREIRLQVATADLGELNVMMYPPRGSSLDRAGLDSLIAATLTTSPAPDLAQVIAYKRTGRAHAFRSNHCTQREDTEAYFTVAAAEADGYTACTSCFEASPLLSDYALERSLGLTTAAHIRYLYPVMLDPDARKHLGVLGRRVLDGWPVPLRGYEYSFEILDSPLLNAFSCAGGKIFICRGLLESVEGDGELEAVLAHEIAHVERRHALANYRSTQKRAALTGLAGVAAAVLTGDARVVAAAAVITNVATSIASAGYGRKHESEADYYALAYLETSDRPRTDLMNVLRKLEYSQMRGGLGGMLVGVFGSHPNIGARLATAESAKFTHFDPPLHYQGMDADSNVVIDVMIAMQVESRYYNQIYEQRRATRPGQRGRGMGGPGGGRVAPSDWTAAEGIDRIRPKSDPSSIQRMELFGAVTAHERLRGPQRIRSVSVAGPGYPLTFDNAQDTTIWPSQSVGMNFVRTSSVGPLPARIADLTMSVKGVRNWTRAE